MTRPKDEDRLPEHVKRKLFFEAYQAADKRTPIDIPMFIQHLEDGNIIEADRVVTECVDDLINCLRKVKEEANVSISFFADYFTWPRTPATRTLSSNSSHHVSFNALKRMGDVFGVTMNELVFKNDNAFPLILPNKHVTWINRFNLLLPKVKVAAANKLKELFSQEPPSFVTAFDYEVLIAKRLVEYCESYAINIRDLGVAKYPVINRTFRLSLHNTAELVKFRGRLQAMIYYCGMTGCALDYFMVPDYSQFRGNIVTSKGENVELDEVTRNVLGLMLRSQNEEQVNHAIAYICAGNISGIVSFDPLSLQ